MDNLNITPPAPQNPQEPVEPQAAPQSSAPQAPVPQNQPAVSPIEQAVQSSQPTPESGGGRDYGKPPSGNFFEILGWSFQFFGRAIASYVKLVLIYVLIGAAVVIAVGGIATLVRSASADTLSPAIEAQFAPSLPGESEEITEEVGALLEEVDDLVEEAVGESGPQGAFFGNPSSDTGASSDIFVSPLPGNPSGLSTGGSLDFMSLFVGGLPFLAVSVFGLLAMIFLQMTLLLSFLRITAGISNGSLESVMSAVKWGFGKFGSYIALMFRIFIYSWMWAAVLIGLVASFAAPFVGNAGVYLNYGAGLLFIILIPVAIVRVLRTIFAQFALADQDCTSKEALDLSIEISKGNWWKILGYLILLMIVVSAASLGVAIVIAFAHEVAGAIASVVIQLVMTIVSFIFQFGLYKHLLSQKQSVPQSTPAQSGMSFVPPAGPPAQPTA